MSGITFDAGGLIALDRHDRRVLALSARAAERGMRITIPATALAQAIRRGKRGSPGWFGRQARISWYSMERARLPLASFWRELRRPTSLMRTSSFVRSGPARPWLRVTQTISGE